VCSRAVRLPHPLEFVLSHRLGKNEGARPRGSPVRANTGGEDLSPKEDSGDRNSE